MLDDQGKITASASESFSDNAPVQYLVVKLLRPYSSEDQISVKRFELRGWTVSSEPAIDNPPRLPQLPPLFEPQLRWPGEQPSKRFRLMSHWINSLSGTIQQVPGQVAYVGEKDALLVASFGLPRSHSWYFEAEYSRKARGAVGYCRIDHHTAIGMVHQLRLVTDGDTTLLTAPKLNGIIPNQHTLNSNSEQVIATELAPTDPIVLGCLLDVKEGRLTFFLNGRPLNHTFSSSSSSCASYFYPCVTLDSPAPVSLNFGQDLWKFAPPGEHVRPVVPIGTPIGPLTSPSYLHPARSPILLDPGVYRWLMGRSAAEVSALRQVIRVVNQTSPDTFISLLNPSTASIPLPPSLLSLPSAVLSQYAFMLCLWDTFTRDFVPLFDASQAQLSPSLHWTIVALRDLMPARTKSFFLKCADLHNDPQVYFECARKTELRDPLAPSVIAQAFTQLGEINPSKLRSRDHLWKTFLVGEGAYDAGGPFRESIRMISDSLLSGDEGLFLPTPNHKTGVGSHRDCVAPPPGPFTSRQRRLYRFVGRIFGAALLASIPLDVSLPPLFWKLLSGASPQSVTDNDFESYDSLALSFLKQLEELPNNPEVTDDTFEYWADCGFQTSLSNDTVVDLVPNGEAIRVNLANLSEYCRLSRLRRFSEMQAAVVEIRAGMDDLDLERQFLFKSGEELQLSITGTPEVDLDLLERTCKFTSSPEMIAAKDMLFAVLRSLTKEQLVDFLSFAWGHSRLAPEGSNSWLPLKLSLSSPGMTLFKSSTCFFSVYVPRLTDQALMKEKLLLSMACCTSMDADRTIQYVASSHDFENEENLE